MYVISEHADEEPKCNHSIHQIIGEIFQVDEVSATSIIPYEVVEKKGILFSENVKVKMIDEGILIRRISNNLLRDK